MKTIMRIIIAVMVVLIFGLPVSATMQTLGKWNESGGTWDTEVNGNFLYVSSGSQVNVYDISTQINLSNISMYRESWRQSDSDPFQGIWKTNLSGLPISKVPSGGVVTNIHIIGNTLYTISDTNFTIDDITDPYSISRISSIGLSGGGVEQIFKYMKHMFMFLMKVMHISELLIFPTQVPQQ